MNKRLAYKNKDGRASIIIPAPALFDRDGQQYKSLCEELKKESMTDSEILSWIAEKDIPQGTPFHEVLADDLPADRYFRNAWETDMTTISINLPKAKEIKLNEFRDLRKPLLAKLDIEYQIADESGDAVKKEQVAAKKQTLRDITLITLPDDIDQLKAFMPTELTEPA